MGFLFNPRKCAIAWLHLSSLLLCIITSPGILSAPNKIPTSGSSISSSSSSFQETSSSDVTTGGNENSSGTIGGSSSSSSTIYTMFSQGEQNMDLEKHNKSAIFLMGNKGSGQSDLAKTIISNYQMENSGDVDTSSYTPQYMVNKENSMAFYSFPGFEASRTPESDTANAYFMEKVTKHVSQVKFMFTVSHSSIQQTAGGDENGGNQEFDLLVTNAAKLMTPTDTGKFSSSIGLVITNVQGGVGDQEILSGAESFMKVYKDELNVQLAAPELGQEIRVLIQRKIAFVEALLRKAENASGSLSLSSVWFLRAPTTGTTENPSTTETTRNPGTTEMTGNPGTTETTGNPGTTESTGNSSTTGTTGNPGTTEMTGNPGTTETTGNPGTTESTGNPGTTESTGNPGTTESTGNPSTTGNPGTTQTTDNPGTTESTENPGTTGNPITTGNPGTTANPITTEKPGLPENELHARRNITDLYLNRLQFSSVTQTDFSISLAAETLATIKSTFMPQISTLMQNFTSSAVQSTVNTYYMNFVQNAFISQDGGLSSSLQTLNLDYNTFMLSGMITVIDNVSMFTHPLDPSPHVFHMEVFTQFSQLLKVSFPASYLSSMSTMTHWIVFFQQVTNTSQTGPSITETAVLSTFNQIRNFKDRITSQVCSANCGSIGIPGVTGIPFGAL